MSPEFPYQIVYFLDSSPDIGETVYSGKNGWYPQLTFKRRFKFIDMDETTGLRYIEEYCSQLSSSVDFMTGELVATDHMPVRYIEVKDVEGEIDRLNKSFVAFMGDGIQSRYPEREGSNYLPHVTAEYDGKMVIDVRKYINKYYAIESLCVIKDAKDENSVALRFYPLGVPKS